MKKKRRQLKISGNEIEHKIEAAGCPTHKNSIVVGAGQRLRQTENDDIRRPTANSLLIEGELTRQTGVTQAEGHFGVDGFWKVCDHQGQDGDNARQKVMEETRRVDRCSWVCEDGCEMSHLQRYTQRCNCIDRAFFQVQRRQSESRTRRPVTHSRSSRQPRHAR